jgi:hypothetical protein
MNFNLQPIRANERDKILGRFIAPEFLSHELGKPGVWFPNLGARAGTTSPVTAESLTELFKGLPMAPEPLVAGQSQGLRQASGWFVEFRVDSMHNTVWAIGDEERRNQVELCHSTAVGKTVERFDALIRRAGGFPPDAKNGPAFAMFQSGTGKGQVPQLTTTVLVPNGHQTRDGSVVTFPAKVIAMARDHLYKSYLAEFVPRALYSFGRLGTHPAIIPRNLFPPPAGDRLIGGSSRTEDKVMFRSADLHPQWRRQAEVRQFGSDALERVLGDARSLARIQGPGFNGHYPPWRIEQMAQRLWASLTEAASKKPDRSHEKQVSRPTL